jgi:Co/Zn/Cd efflux system component
MMTLEAEVTPGTDLQAPRQAIKRRLAQRFGIEHATVEIDEGRLSDPSAFQKPGATRS